MVNTYFIRQEGRRLPRGYVADIPNNFECSYIKPFIIVSIDEETIPSGLLINNSIQLKLDQLMARYPDSTEQYTVIDEDGNEEIKTRIVYGYFDKLGNSTVEGERITLDDLDWVGK